MKKTFTINVPDELWVDAWNNNKTETYTYNGPEKVYVLISDRTDDIAMWSVDPIVSESKSNDFVIEVDANQKMMLSVAHYIVSQGSLHEYTYKDETNHDGSIHSSMQDPTIHDYFSISYNRAQGVVLVPMYKNTKTTIEETAEKRLAYVKKYNNIYEFDNDDQLTIDEFISKMNAYLTIMETAYPWKYITIDDSEIPKIPAKLMKIFSAFPNLDAGE